MHTNIQTIVTVKCLDQVLQLINAPRITSGGVNDVRAEFEFCPLWDSLAKSAVFYTDPKNVYKQVLEEDACDVPPEVLAVPGLMYMGVFGVNAAGDVVRTSGVLVLNIEPGAITEATAVSDPTPELYQQILAEVQKAREAAEEANPVDIDLAGAPLEYVTGWEEDGEVKAGKAVLYAKQTLTKEEQVQARKNIGAAGGEDIIAELAKRGQLKPELANSIEECTDTTKLYVLPDGYIYAYMMTETEGGVTPNFTNLMDDAGAYVKKGYRYSSSSAAFKEYADGASIVFPYNASPGTHIFRIRGGSVSPQYASSFYLGDNNQSFPYTRDATVSTDGNGDVVYNTSSSTEISGYLCLCIYGVTDENSVIVTLNEEITYTITEGDVSYKWANTGHAFVPADYEDRIVDIETNVATHGRKIAEIESKVENIGADESETAAYNRIRNWQYPIYEDAPVFLLETNKPALTASDMTTAGIYAKYDALMAANPHYISRVNCGKASDGTTPIYCYHFRQPDPHYLHNGSSHWSEKKPTFLVCSGVHPLEQTGVHSMFHALEEITTNPKLFDLKRNLHIIVFPMLNPTAFEDDSYYMRNPDGVQVHHNFEVGHGENGAVQGDRYYGGATPLSIPETQYFDEVMSEYKDSLVCVMSCHNNELDERHGTGVIWCSCATHFTCNLGFRFADKMSIAWREKHGAEVFDAGIRWANDFVLAQYENPTISDFNWMFDNITPERQEDWDYLVGRSNMSGSGGTEYRQGTKYGIHGVNVETCPRCMILDRDYNAKNTSNAITMGTETYINYFRTFMAAYDPKDKKDYAPNLPWSE